MKWNMLTSGFLCLFPGLLYGLEGDARRTFQKQPLKVTNMGVAPAYLTPKSYQYGCGTGIF